VGSDAAANIQFTSFNSCPAISYSFIRYITYEKLVLSYTTIQSLVEQFYSASVH